MEFGVICLYGVVWMESGMVLDGVWDGLLLRDGLGRSVGWSASTAWFWTVSGMVCSTEWFWGLEWFVSTVWFWEFGMVGFYSMVLGSGMVCSTAWFWGLGWFVSTAWFWGSGWFVSTAWYRGLGWFVSTTGVVFGSGLVCSYCKVLGVWDGLLCNVVLAWLASIAWFWEFGMVCFDSVVLEV